MHIYIYDSFLNERKYESRIAKIETRLTDLGLNGKIIRLGLLQSLDDSVQNELRKGAKTIVAVGNIGLLNRCINAVMRYYKHSGISNPVPVAFIPMGDKDNQIADKLGIPKDQDACNVISARRVERIDLGVINNNYFFSEAWIPTEGTSIRVDNSYTIEIKQPGRIYIINFQNEAIVPDIANSSATDATLEFLIETSGKKRFMGIPGNEKESSLFRFNRLRIESRNNSPMHFDSVNELACPCDISVAPAALNLIVGKSRYL